TVSPRSGPVTHQAIESITVSAVCTASARVTAAGHTGSPDCGKPASRAPPAHPTTKLTIALTASTIRLPSPVAAPTPVITMFPVITLANAPPSARNPMASVAPLVTASSTARRSRTRSCAARRASSRSSWSAPGIRDALLLRLDEVVRGDDLVVATRHPAAVVLRLARLLGRRFPQQFDDVVGDRVVLELLQPVRLEAALPADGLEERIARLGVLGVAEFFLLVELHRRGTARMRPQDQVVVLVRVVEDRLAGLQHHRPHPHVLIGEDQFVSRVGGEPLRGRVHDFSLVCGHCWLASDSRTSCRYAVTASAVAGTLRSIEPATPACARST